MRVADEVIDRVVMCSQIPPVRRREIRRELRAHIEDFVAAAHEAGHPPDEIERLVLAHFGDPGQIAEGFAWVYRYERRRLRLLAYTLSTVLLAGSLLAAILVVQAGLAFGLGTPIMLASRHTAIEALDILSSVAVYLGLTSLEGLFRERRLQKAAALLTLILAVIMGLCGAAGWHAGFLVFGLVNGVFFRAVRLFVAARVARAGIVLFCFSLAGLVFAQLWSPGSQAAIVGTCASWLAMGAGYLLVTDLAPRVDAALRNGLQRI